VAQDILVTRVITVFGLLALGLAALGLYGVTAYATSQRTSEFGLRAALGAQPSEVLRMILREAVSLVMIGTIIGVPTAFLMTRLIRERLFGVGPIDVPSLAAAIVVLTLTSLVASYVPARRASRVGPLTALRAE
jgi:ABC-type antimicrobial peptide transport system permease subunit